MMRKFVIILSGFLFSVSVFPQSDTTYWKTAGDFSIQFNQVSFSNWATGGDNSLAGVIGLKYDFNYAKEKLSWDNKLVLAYGLQRLGGDTRKTEDKIDFASKCGHQLKKEFFFATMFTLKSQFANGYNYPNRENYISTFNSPLYIGIGVGIDYKPNANLSLYLSPATAQFIIIADDYLSAIGVFGNAPGEKIRTQFGTSFKMQYTKEIAKNMNLDTKFEAFLDYLDNSQTNIIKNIIYSWNMMLDMKVNTLISAKLNTALIYDPNIIFVNPDGSAEPKVQLMEMFGAGLSVKF